MKREKKLTETFTFKITDELLINYKKYCDDNGFSLSKRLRFFMEKDIENKIEIKK
jgi:hypothetical protein